MEAKEGQKKALKKRPYWNAGWLAGKKKKKKKETFVKEAIRQFFPISIYLDIKLEFC